MRAGRRRRLALGRTRHRRRDHQRRHRRRLRPSAPHPSSLSVLSLRLRYARPYGSHAFPKTTAEAAAVATTLLHEALAPYLIVAQPRTWFSYAWFCKQHDRTSA